MINAYDEKKYDLKLVKLEREKWSKLKIYKPIGIWQNQNGPYH